ncbi:hypothetical protein TR51_25015 [Kitasatospora griseola]|uniref:CAAX protease n=1 Tax=Kitasatospora griseola TaxID=2064 RepID=A0A0D0PIM6_KITGR|nr:hypothetical protein [Kitasatospora griseola]KIQ62344.1 hypothetical protein TR51_25015 [Kitasatospora griseola]
MTDALPGWMCEALSEQRLAPYRAAAERDKVSARLLYWWNAEVSGAFLGPLHCLELTLRNALHSRLADAFGRPDWWAAAALDDHGRKLVEEARRKRERRRDRVLTADGVMAELSFGFWVSLLSAGDCYDRRLWVPILHRAFPHYSGPRRELHRNFESMRLFRNRIGHHEPIHHRKLEADHAKIYELLAYLSPAMAAEARAMDRVPEILRMREQACGGLRPPRF